MILARDAVVGDGFVIGEVLEMGELLLEMSGGGWEICGEVFKNASESFSEHRRKHTCSEQCWHFDIEFFQVSL